MRSLGLDVGGTNLKAAVLAAREVIHTETVPLPRTGGIETALGVGAELAESHRVETVGVGLAGLVRWQEGLFAWGPHLSGAGTPVRDSFVEEIGLPVFVDNDAHMAAVAELILGVARGVRDGLLITLGTGVGAALIAEGRVYRGRSFAGEPGHVTAVPGGRLCACGRRGCWETVVSGSRLDEEAGRLATAMPHGGVARAAGGSVPNAMHLVEAADGGDTAAIDALEQAGEDLGRLIAHLAAILDPEVVVIGGGLSAAARWMAGSAATSCSTHLHGAAYREPVDIRFSTLAGMAGAIGAALAAQEVNRV